ncbi:unnamed protein product [Diatraea saccharalis]|uniref:Uncharacterized protein n=1 Tax=Diatraea saccharalis TaxID=40085 RepID=A0A9N9R3B5_9NEOP|nr:unnamed protein product [Diatraea saccharalis]
MGHDLPRLLIYIIVLTTANAAGTNGLTCLPKHGVARDNNFLVTHPDRPLRNFLNDNDRRPRRLSTATELLTVIDAFSQNNVIELVKQNLFTRLSQSY